MTASSSSTKVFGLFDVIVMTVVANFGIRWLAVAAGLGPESIFFWCIGAVLFFLPLAILSANLSRSYPQEGGIYAWVKLALGEKSAFMVAWLYWVNSVFYYPAIMIFFATNFAYAINQPALANSHTYITLSVLIGFWLVILVSLFGLKTSKYLIAIGGVLGTMIPVVAIIILSAVSLLFYQHSATDFNVHNWLPSKGIFTNLSVLTIIMFAMAGIEVVPTFANSVRNPRRDLYLGLAIGAVMIFLFYVLGTCALNIILKPTEINSTAGLINAFSAIDTKFGIPWLTRTIAFLLTFSEFSATIIWLVAPIIIFFKCTPKGVLPDWFHKTNRYGSLSNSLVFMGVLVTAVVLLTNFVPTINDMYQILVLMATILYFIPYLFLAIAYAKLSLKKSRYKLLIYTISGCILFSVTLGILFSFPPPSNLVTTRDIVLYELELILGPVLFIVLGLFLSKKSQRISRDNRA